MAQWHVQSITALLLKKWESALGFREWTSCLVSLQEETAEYYPFLKGKAESWKI